MGGSKETPRQKMIGLMYLVLMALLAMNVSKEVINSFVTLSNNMDEQFTDLVKSNGNIINELSLKSSDSQLSKREQQELSEILEKANTIHDMTRKASNFYMNNANELLQEGEEGDWIVENTDGFYSIKDLVVNEYSRKDDYDIPTRFFVGQDHSNINDRGISLVKNMENYRDSICIILAKKSVDNQDYYFEPPSIERLNAMDTSYIETLEIALETVKESDRQTIREVYRGLTLPKFVDNHGEEYPWQAGQFDHAPMVAATAILTSLKGRILQAEKFVLNNFNDKHKLPPFKFNKIQPLAFSQSNYINAGDSLKMSVMVAAFDSTSSTEVRYWIDDTTRKKENMLTSTLNQLTFGGSVGDHIVVGDIAVKTHNGIEWQPFTYNYSVGAPNAAVGALDVNVLFSQGWKNRIEVSAGGYDPSKVIVKGDNCTVTKSSEGYIVKTNATGQTAKVIVKAEDADGNIVTLKEQVFRVLPLPKPELFYANKGQGEAIQQSLIKNQFFPLKAKCVNTVIDAQYEVSSFKLFYFVGGSPVELSSNSDKLTNKMKNAFKNMGKGTPFFFKDVKVTGPSGAKVKVPDLSLKVK